MIRAKKEIEDSIKEYGLEDFVYKTLIYFEKVNANSSLF